MSHTHTQPQKHIHSFIHSLRFPFSLFSSQHNHTYMRSYAHAHAHVHSINRSVTLSSYVQPLHHKANIIVYTTFGYTQAAKNNEMEEEQKRAHKQNP